jgi:hypothetical protein
MEFEADAKVTQVCNAYVADMLEFANSQYGLELDFSIDSVSKVEEIANDIASNKPRFSLFRRKTEQRAEGFSKMLGFYLAETMRRQWGGEHGWVTAEGARFYGLRLTDGSLCWPVGRAQQRITAGRENNLRDYVIAMEPEPQSPTA